MNRKRLTVWWVKDGKPGHENQVRGLLSALERRFPLTIEEVAPISFFGWLSGMVFNRYSATDALADPHLIIGAGHATHSAILLARRQRGGFSIVLMKPAWWINNRWFNLCVTPEHDDLYEAGTILNTRGVLNTIQPATSLDQQAGLMLVGGPSKHHGWDSEEMLEQIRQVVERNPDIAWTLTDSRRTPVGFLEQVAALNLAGMTTIPCQETPQGWVAEQLSRCRWVWVSEDSVSMVYEAVTAGGSVGILTPPRRKQESRITRGLESLVADGLVMPFDRWTLTNRLPPPSMTPFHEAERIAEAVVARLFKKSGDA
ncbi:MAG: mitochondrial fission ELM1 family protein [Magnetococcales bacterium]|nr:mitochondrial fission ELM1 family protein [Magnetococcales bacterium]